MLRALTFTSLLLASTLLLAKTKTSLYQIDIIAFAHLKAYLNTDKNALVPVVAPETAHAIPLLTTVDKKMTPYHLLPTSASHLRDEYWALSRKPQYQIIFHYSWLQPGNNTRPVALTKLNTDGWNVEGTLKIEHSNFYLLDTELFFSVPNSPHSSFLFSQKQRLKPEIVYYLDHPQAGILIKIHSIT